MSILQIFRVRLPRTSTNRLAARPPPALSPLQRMRRRHTMGYREVYEAWKADPEGFWMEAAQAIDWDEAPKKALFDRGDNLYEWFADARVNTCWNAVDRHVEQ